MTTLGDAWIRVRPDTSGFRNEANRSLSGSLKSIAKQSAAGLAVAAAATAVALGAMAKAAAQDQQSQALLAKQLQNSAGATKGQVAQTERWITAQGKALGVTDEELRPALARLATATHSVSGAQKLASLAMDVSAGTGKSLSAVSTALMKAQNGQVSSLSRLGINTKDATGKTISMREAVKRMGDEFGGAAKAKAETLSGKMQRLRVMFDEGKEAIGARLIPMLTRLAGWVTTKVVPAVGRLSAFIQSRVAPAVREFAGQIKTNVLPAAVRFGEIIGSKLKPVLDALVDTVKNQIIPTWRSWLPTITSIAAKIGLFAAGAVVLASAIAGKVLPPIIVLVGWLVTFKPLVIGVVAAFVAWKTVTLAMAVAAALSAANTAFWTAAITANIAISKAAAIATKVWSVTVAVLNAVMDGNPIALVVIAIAAFVAAVVIAYKKSDTFRRIVAAAWDKIKQAVSAAWNGVIKPILAAYAAYITKVLIPAIKFLWNNVVRPVFSSIGKAIKITWTGIIQPVFKAWQAYLTRVVFPVIRFLYERVVKPIFKSVGDVIQSVWNNAIKPTFSKLKEGVGAIKDAFKNAVDKIKTFWNGLKEAAAAPVRFVVNTVYNNGIRKVVNAIPGVGDLPAIHMASGGVLPGYSPGRDVHEFVSRTGGRLHLSGGEAIMRPEWVRQMGGPLAINRMNKAARMGNYRKVGDVGAFKDGGTLDAQAASRAAAFAYSANGKPYVWGGVGPNGYDCSGFMSAITNVMRGKYPYSRVGATASFPWPGFTSGPGTFTIGSSPNYGGSGIGHMAGTIRGLNVESSGGQGVHLGAGARGYNDPGFSTHAHIGGLAGSPFGAIIGDIKGLWTKLHGAVAKLSNMGEWGGLMKKAVTSIAAGIKDWINGKIPGPGPLPSFDRGGMARGRGSLLKNTMRPERVLSARQTEAFERLVSALEAGSLGGVHIDTINTRDDKAAAYAMRVELQKATTLMAGA